MRIPFVKMILAVMTLSILYQPATAGDWTVKVTPQSSPVGAPTIEVYSSGNEWTDIKSDWKKVKLSTEVEVSSGWRVVRVYLGFPSADFCSEGHGGECILMYHGATKHVKLDGREYEFSTDHIGGLDALAIVNACNAGDHDPTQDRDPFESEISVGIKAFIPRRSETNDPQETWDIGRTEFDYARVPVIVRCLAPVAMQEAGPKPISVDIRVKQKGETCPKDAEVTAYIDYDKPMTGRFRVIHNGKQGKIIEIKARKMSFAGKTFYRIERLERYKLDPGKHNFKIKVIGGGHSKKETVTVDCPPFEVTSTWLTYEVEDKDACKKQVVETATIHANRPGDVPYRIETQGGLVVTQGIAYVARKGDQYVAKRTRKLSMGAFDQMMRLIIVNDPSVGVTQTPLKVECVYKPTDTGASTDLAPETRPEDPPVVGPTLTGDFSFVDNGGTKCPRQGKALVNFKTSKPDNVHWSLDCTNGHFSGVAQTAPSPKGGYIAPALVTFDINQTTHAKCALKTVAPGNAKVHTLKGHIFQCVRTTGVGGADDLAPDSRPDPQKPDKPGKVVDPVKPDKPGTSVVDPVKPDEQKPNKATVSEPKLTCANGAVKKGACSCEPNFKPVKAGQNAWRCVRSVADPKPVKPTVSQPKISCANGTAKNGACNCDRTHKPVKVGKNAWRCVRVVADPPKNKSGANKLELKTAPKKMSQPKKTAKPKSGAGKMTGLKPKGKAAKKPTSLLAPR